MKRISSGEGGDIARQICKNVNAPVKILVNSSIISKSTTY
jgi:hypothetical protein